MNFRILKLSTILFLTLLFGGQAFANELLGNEVIDVTFDSIGNSAISPIIYRDEPFNSIAVNLPFETDSLMVNFDPLAGGVWEQFEVHDDGWGPEKIIFGVPATAVQFKVLGQEFDQHGHAGHAGGSFKMSAHFHLSEVSGEAPERLAGDLVAAANGVRIIKRAQWGADENLRYRSPEVEELLNRSRGSGDRTDPCEKQVKDFPQETAVARTISYSPRGDRLVWPLSYTTRIRKMVVHHTDSELRDLNGDRRTDSRDYKAMVQAIYYFHAISRGWGDIGYNYIVDPLGNVYEGRYGGEKVIGAHSLCHNNGTIGIAVIGDYENKAVPQPAMNSLIKLIGLKAKQYRIDPDSSTVWRGKRRPNILGHKDVRATSCPGKRLVKALPRIRERAALVARSGVFTEGTINAQTLEYNAQLMNDPSTVVLPPNARSSITLKYKNTGTQTWDRNTWLHVSLNNRPQARVVSVLEDKAFVAANMKESRVSPGQIATFEVEFEGGYTPGSYTFELAPVVNGRFKVSRSAVFVNTQVQEAVYGYRVVQSDLPEGTVFQGQKIKASMQIQNTGNVKWVNYGNNPIRLGTEALRDRRSLLVKKHTSRLAHLLESEVDPGETGTFVFDLEIPTRLKGKHVERFTPVIEGVRWLDDRGLRFEVNVKKPRHLASIEEKSKIQKLNPGERVKVDFVLRNKGDISWHSDNMKVQLLARGLKAFKSKLVPTEEVSPNHSAHLDFWLQAPYESGQHRLFLQSKFNNKVIRGGSARYLVRVGEPRIRAQLTDQTQRNVNLQPGEVREIEVKYKNIGNAVWHQDGQNAVYLAPGRPQDRESELYYEGEWVNKFRAGRLVEREVNPGEIGTFRFKVRPMKKGKYREYFQLVMEGVGWIPGYARWDFNVSGDVIDEPVDQLKDARRNQEKARLITRAKRTTTKRTTTRTTTKRTASQTRKTTTVKTEVPKAEPVQKVQAKVSKEQPFRVRLDYYADQSIINADKAFYILNGDNELLFDLITPRPIAIRRAGGKVHVQLGDAVKTASAVRIIPKTRGIVEIVSMQRRPSWNRQLNDNRFRGGLEVRVVGGKMAYINELAMEDYLLGLAEVSNHTHPEKQKVMAILARTYARFYMDPNNRKFPGMPYDGNDDPAVFQRYLGYGYEIRSPNFAKAVRATEDLVVTYNGELVKTPYFTQSDGRTLSALEVWGWTNTPYLESVDDPHCRGLIRRGHGVGLSGCGSDALAKEGRSYEEIIKYYYQGVEIERLKF